MWAEAEEPKTAAEVLERARAVNRLRQKGAHVVNLAAERRRQFEEARRRVVELYREVPITGAKPIELIIAEVCYKYHTDPATLKGRKHQRSLSAARHEAASRIYMEHPRMSLVGIGRLLGGRDHATIRNSLEKTGVLYKRGDNA